MAVVGVGLRLPGGITSLGGLWTALEEGRDLVGEVPDGRFDTAAFVAAGAARAGKSYTAAGGLLDDVASFDAGYFGISPKEASRIDPQQRLLLECAVEAFDDAAIDPAKFAGSDAAVVMGVSSHDYTDLQQRRPRTISPYTMGGSASCNTANRLSYVFDFHGPSNAVDTACSSALTAVHQACEALRSGRAPLALAGGVNVILNPYGFAGFSQASMLSPTGRCRPFSAQADGYVRSEGAGVLLLKPLAAALADGDRVHAVILASGVNADGRTAGLTLPSARSQAALLERVYVTAGIGPDEVAYVEAHGTGTQVGDPIECESLGRALGRGRRATAPLPVGSVKSNLGHLEAASGVAGLLKGLLVLRKRTIPGTVHAVPPNPAIDFASLGLEPVTEQRPLHTSGRGVVGVNSFGFGGSNAHVVLAEAPGAGSVRSSDGPPSMSDGPSSAKDAAGGTGRLPVVVSARTPQALAAAAHAWGEHFQEKAEQPGAEPAHAFYDAAFTACRRRAGQEHRIAVLADGPQQVAAALRSVAEGKPAAGAVSAASVSLGRVGFVFDGNGSQWVGMGADLLSGDLAFTTEVAAVDAELAPMLGWSVLSELARAPDPSRWHRTEVAQPLLFAVQAGVVAALAARGVEPAAVVGHSVGEVAAAYCSGALSRSQACRVIAERSRAQAATAGSGRMAAVGLGADAACGRLAAEGYGERLAVAGVNSDQDVTIAGESTALEEFGGRLDDEGVFFLDLGLDYAFHSAAMDIIEAPLREALADVRPGKCRIPLISTVTGEALAGPELNASYWWRNVREPVRFAEAVDALTGAEHQCDVLVEIGPHPVLSTYLRRAAAKRTQPVAVVTTVSRSLPGPAALDEAYARLLAVGAQVDWTVVFPRQGRVADLPAYPWQRERHWNGHPDWWLEDTAQAASQRAQHPLLGARQPVADPVWRRQVEANSLTWMGDHVVSGAVVWPAAGYVDMALGAGREILDAPIEVTGLRIGRALTLPFDDPDMRVQLSTSLAPDGVLVVSSRSGEQGDWNEHARGRVRRLLRDRPPALDPGLVGARLSEAVSVDEHYAACARAGLPYGPAFRPLAALRTGPGEVLAAYRCTIEPSPGHQAHPTLLDGALQAGMPLIAALGGDACPFLPASIETVRAWQPMSETGLVHVRARTATATQEVVWDITVSDTDGVVTLEVLGCKLRRFEAGRPPRPQRLTEVLRAAPLPGEAVRPVPLPSPQEVFATCEENLGALAAGWSAGPYGAFRTDLLRMVAHFVGAAVRELLPETDVVTVESLLAAGADAKCTRLLHHLLGTAVEHGVLAAEGTDRWRLTGEPAPQELFDALLKDYPGWAVMAQTYGLCGQHLSGVLRRTTSPLELLFSDTDALAARFYDGVAMGHQGRSCETLMAGIVERWPRDRPLRILEVGAGTGATTAALVPHLPPERTRYTFTDISPAFFAQAKHRLSRYDFVDYRALDLDADPAGQGFAESSFDIVVASNVLHATKDLKDALRRVAGLLADGGHLLALEYHDNSLLAPVFGLLDSFWEATDDELRPAGPLLARDEWESVLRDCGFSATAQSGPASPASLSDNSVILAARRPRSHDIDPGDVPEAAAHDTGSRTWLVGELPRNSRTQTPMTGSMVAALREHGHGVAVRAVSVEDTVESWTALLCGEQSPTDVVLIAEAVEADEARSATEKTETAVRHLAVLGAIGAACERRPDPADLTVWVVSCDPDAVVSTPPVPESAAVWGAARTLANEHQELTVRRIALAGVRDAENRKLLAERATREMVLRPEEDEVLLTPAGRFVTVVRPLDPPQGFSGADGFTLTLNSPGLHYRLGWRPADIPRPRAGEVVVAVGAAALNYKDVMIATGQVPAASTGRPDSAGIGFECAGVITAVGPGVTAFAPGDRVAAMGEGCFGSHAVVHADRAMTLPADMTFAEGATLLLVGLTVEYSLGHLARLAAGETLLVHGAAGGVGLAALQYARRVGAHVIATAGTPVKRDLLRLLGVEHVLDSRRLHFAEQVKDLTAGQGVDVVLNSLAGEALVRSVGVLKPHGRFLELGRRDFLMDSRLPLAPFVHNLAFFGVDLTTMVGGTSAVLDTALAALAAAVHDGTYHPLPFRTYPARRIEEAFTSLQHSRHTGKIVITFEEGVQVQNPLTGPDLDSTATYLVTGGLGGFGAATARHLAARGARHLTLLSRSGTEAPEAASLLADLRDDGTDVTAYAADVTDEAALRRVLDDIGASGRRLAGVVHAAMVLDDAPLAGLSNERLRTVLGPKMTGGLLLDTLTRDRSLDFFVVYSSVAALIGNIRQAPYVSGNMVLEALVRDRHRAGVPALAVQWGAIGDSGYVHRSGRNDEMAALGLNELTCADALTELDRLLVHPDARVVTVGHFDWDRLGRLTPHLAVPRTAGLLRERDETGFADRMRIAFGDATPAQAAKLVEKKLSELLAGVLQTTPERIDRDRRLDLLGVDSLMALEFTAVVSRDLGCELPVVEVTGAAHLSEIAQRVLTRLGYRAVAND
ncbi:type I polyketide synthase [Streptomyces sp. MB09-01]|uniref:type I polyketide synthase n=1 Tax=Streptomyces sp. MB09-01 TaxID=3028666 RepID=UPI0029A32F0A|nr:type I polyketide synthase [Streptomyces sp. MB09-01]MDX3535903.1 type I polyketide synthase [Streptomyces sp. MB09-01]